MGPAWLQKNRPPISRRHTKIHQGTAYVHLSKYCQIIPQNFLNTLNKFPFWSNRYQCSAFRALTITPNVLDRFKAPYIMVVVVEMNLIISAKRKFMHDQIPALIIGFDLVDSICVGFTATLAYMTYSETQNMENCPIVF
ncbi:uncharacterized protein H6S33_002252 [Morchella sextelata]|uniref:uncharacterized protein n=1 Tax=Morchella sextelata TaxID=1174677 RepID=UPI001D05681E|nr:uncharacterized protein H6S33_002252 [Morchella sextelata]KAH0608200.1 hypothetical protein H6S33_002252 [Morchella sextelata]